MPTPNARPASPRSPTARECGARPDLIERSEKMSPVSILPLGRLCRARSDIEHTQDVGFAEDQPVLALDQEFLCRTISRTRSDRRS
jgi:hypothetical protein